MSNPLPALSTPPADPRGRSAPSAADRAICRVALPRVSRTFALNIRLLGGSLRETVRVAYLLCRIADTIEDAWPGRSDQLERRFDAFLDAVEGDAAAADRLAREASSAPAGIAGAHLDLVAHFPSVWRCYRALADEDRDAVADGVRTLACGMRRYAARMTERLSAAGADTAGNPAPGAVSGSGDGAAVIPYLDTEAELGDYCWVVAGCVGVMLTRLFALRAPADSRLEARRLELAPAVGEGLQLTNILLDWPHDMRRGRCYVPAAWLAPGGLVPRDLVGTPRAGVPEVADRLEALARAALARVPDYLDTLPARHVRYRMFCLWPALWALASLRHARRVPEFPWGGPRPRLPRSELWSWALRSLWSGHGSGSLRRMYAELSERHAGHGTR